MEKMKEMDALVDKTITELPDPNEYYYPNCAVDTIKTNYYTRGLEDGYNLFGKQLLEKLKAKRDKLQTSLDENANDPNAVPVYTSYYEGRKEELDEVIEMIEDEIKNAK